MGTSFLECVHLGAVSVAFMVGSIHCFPGNVKAIDSIKCLINSLSTFTEWHMQNCWLVIIYKALYVTEKNG